MSEINDLPPWEQLSPQPRKQKPSILVNLDRCIGCHACSVACKNEHSVPLGEFRMRVRWLPRPDRESLAFVPVFDGKTCDFDPNRQDVGLPPACVANCPTSALTFGDAQDPADPVAQAIASGQTTPNPKPGVLCDGIHYLRYEEWMTTAMRQGVRLSPDDPDITYEQPARKGGKQ